MKEQVFEYDYIHYPVNLECDVNVLVLSKGASRLNLHLPFCVAIPPQFCDGIDPTSVLKKPDDLRECRHAIQVSRNNVEHICIPDEVTKEVTESFVQSRTSGADPEAASDQLHRLLTISRLLTALSGKAEVTSDIWKTAQSMEKERVEVLDDFRKKEAERK